jgi:SPRY domain-containing SOCS box protein 1/4
MRPTKLDALLDLPEPTQKQMEQNAWNPDDRSLNIYVKEEDRLTLHRHPVAQSTDCIRGRVGYSKGFHVWQIVWPLRQRGTHAVIGVASKDAPLHAPGYSSLVGSTTDSYGWDLSKLFCRII